MPRESRPLAAPVQLSRSQDREQPAVSGFQSAIPLRHHVVFYMPPDPLGPFLRVRPPRWRTAILWKTLVRKLLPDGIAISSLY